MAQQISVPGIKQHALFWSAAFAFFITAVWVLGDILMPFVLGFAIAYLLNPIMSFLAGRNVPRTLSALFILGLFFTFVAAIIAAATPALYRETTALADAMPGYAEKISAILAPYINWAQERLGSGDTASYQQAIQNNAGKALNIGMGVLGGIASGGQALAGFLSVTVLTPIVAFFMMKEWATMTNWLDSLLPRGNYKALKELQRQIDGKVAGFIRGQLSVAFILAVAYAIALTVAGLQFGFLIGIMAGVLSIIPLVGSTVGLLVGVIVAWFQAGEWSYVAIIAAVFLTGQFIEGNFLTPKLLGQSVGLHPLWILFALLAGGSLFGIVGMLLAVPVTAVIGVLAGFAIQQYKNSPYYKDKKTAAKKAPAKKGASDKNA